MADQKPTTNFYRNLGGVNQKASEYSLDTAQFLNLRNVDFDVPNALQKRPGSTQAVSANTSGPVTSLFEYIQLNGASQVIAGTDTAMFYLTSNAYTLLDAGWNNGQPTDMLTFVNKLWMANGQKFYGWSGVGATPLPAGLPCQTQAFTLYGGATLPNPVTDFFQVGGATMKAAGDGLATHMVRGVYLAYSFLRNDGYNGPCDFFSSARQIVYSQPDGSEYFSIYAVRIGGVTVPPGRGITAINIWIAVDSAAVPPDNPFTPTKRTDCTGLMGDIYNYGTSSVPYWFFGLTLKTDADLSRFHLLKTIAASSLTINSIGGVTYYTAGTILNSTFAPQFNSFTGVATGQNAFSGMPFCWFDTNTPKYIDINQNSMFMSGFSNNPSVLAFSEVGEPENIQPEFNIEIRTNDGDRIYGHKTYNNQTMAWKENSFHKVIGDSPENYELVELSTEYGCVSNQTAVEYREKLVWLDKKGIVEFNGANWDIISTPVEDIFRRMNLSAAFEKACGVHHLYRNQIWWGIPIDGSTQNNITVVYDYLVNGWTFFDGFNPSSFALVKGALTKPTAWRGNYSGMIFYHGESFYGDNGQGISCVMLPHWDKNKENETWIWRRFFLDVATATGLTGQITGKLYSDYNLSTVRGTFAMYQNAFQSRAEVGVVGKAVTAEFSHFSASLPLLINGYSWAKRFLRNV